MGQDLSLATTPSASPLNGLRFDAGYPNRPRTSPVALSPYRRHRAWMLNRALAVARTLLAIFASRADLMNENLALRPQLAVLQREYSRPRLLVIDRLLWLGLRRWWPRWEEALAIVQPATVIRWHRDGFGRYSRWKSRRHAGRPSTTADIRALVHRLAAENPSWGACAPTEADRRHLFQPAGMAVADTRGDAFGPRACLPFQAAGAISNARTRYCRRTSSPPDPLLVQGQGVLFGRTPPALLRPRLPSPDGISAVTR